MKRISEILDTKFSNRRAFWKAAAIGFVVSLLLVSLLTCGFESIVTACKEAVLGNG